MNYCRKCREHTQPIPEKRNRCGTCGSAYHGFYRLSDEKIMTMDSRGMLKVEAQHKT